MSKIIAITDDLYERLKSMKGENESFSKIIVKNIERNNNKEKIMQLFGSMKEELKNIDASKYVKGVRKKWKWRKYA